MRMILESESLQLSVERKAATIFTRGGHWMAADRRAHRHEPIDTLDIGSVTFYLWRSQTLDLLREMIHELPSDAEGFIVEAGVSREYLKERIEEEVA